jgi:TusA-related sulfurtransferase
MKEVRINGRKIRVTSSIDAVGLFCPAPIVRLKIELDKMNSNQVVEVLADDPGFKNDIVVWCNRTHNELLLLTKNEDDVFIAFIEKAKE